jgi:hypothetical protein
MKKQIAAAKKHGTVLQVIVVRILAKGSSSLTREPRISDITIVPTPDEITKSPITDASVPRGAVSVIIEREGAALPSPKNSSIAINTTSIAKLLKKKNAKK